MITCTPNGLRFLDRTLERNPDIEVLVHGFVFSYSNEWTDAKKDAFTSTHYGKEQIDSWEKPWSFEHLWNQSIVANFSGSGGKWVIGDPTLEPNHIQNKGVSARTHWWFPINMTLSPPIRRSAHNGWVTGRKKSLQSVPYPDVKRGQDSLFNWRLLKSHHNFTFLDFQLGAYIFREGVS